MSQNGQKTSNLRWKPSTWTLSIPYISYLSSLCQNCLEIKNYTTGKFFAYGWEESNRYSLHWRSEEPIAYVHCWWYDCWHWCRDHEIHLYCEQAYCGVHEVMLGECPALQSSVSQVRTQRRFYQAAPRLHPPGRARFFQLKQTSKHARPGGVKYLFSQPPDCFALRKTNLYKWQAWEPSWPKTKTNGRNNVLWHRWYINTSHLWHFRYAEYHTCDGHARINELAKLNLETLVLRFDKHCDLHEKCEELSPM